MSLQEFENTAEPAQEQQPQLQEQPQTLQQESQGAEEQGGEQKEVPVSGGYFEFDDGGWYAGDWIDGQAYGYGKCTGPQGKGEYSGTWRAGFEVSGVYTWPNGRSYSGDWLSGKRNGLGVETKDKWVYKGEWQEGLKSKYGVKYNTGLPTKYEGSWVAGMQDGYGVETYIDESTYHGQWSKGTRHGFGIRKSALKGLSAPYRSEKNALKSASSLPSNLFPGSKFTSASSYDALYASTVDNRRSNDSDKHKGGFVLVEKLKSSASRSSSLRRSRSTSLSRSLSKRLKLMRSGSISTLQRMSHARDDAREAASLRGSADIGRNCLMALSVDVGLACAVETYAGEWKNDKRCGYGVSERSDGLKYEGGWLKDKRSGYGVTTYRDGLQEEGKYHDNELVATLAQKRRLFSNKKFKDRLDASIAFARKAAQNSALKADVAMVKRNVAMAKANLADDVARKANYLAEIARKHAKKFYIHYEDEHMEREEIVAEKPRSKKSTGGSLSGCSDNYKTSFPVDSLNDDVFIQASKNDPTPTPFPLNNPPFYPHKHQKTNLIKNSHSSLKSGEHDQPSRENCFREKNGSSTDALYRKKNHSLDRKTFPADFKQQQQSFRGSENNLMTQPPRKRLSNSMRDYLNGSPLQLPDSLKPLKNGSIPVFVTDTHRTHSVSKSNEAATPFPKAHNQPHSYLSYLNTNTNDRAQKLRRRFSSKKHNKFDSVSDPTSFQSIDMLNHEKKFLQCSSSAFKNSNSNTLQQPSFRQKNIFSIDSHTDSIRPSPHADIRSRKLSNAQSNKDTNLASHNDIGHPSWIQENLIVIFLIVLNAFSVLYFVFCQKDKK